MRPVVDERLIVVERLLAVVRRADGPPPQAAAIYVIFALQRVTEGHPIIGRRLPIAASGEQRVAQRRGREACQDAPLAEVAHAGQDYRVLEAVFERGEKPQLVAFDRPAERTDVLLAVELRPPERRDDPAIEGRRQRRERVVAKVEPGGAVQFVPPVLVTTLIAEDAERPMSAEKRLVMI